MPPVGFEPTISAGELNFLHSQFPQTLHCFRHFNSPLSLGSVQTFTNIFKLHNLTTADYFLVFYFFVYVQPSII